MPRLDLAPVRAALAVCAVVALGAVGGCSGAVTVASTSTAAPASSGPAARATVPMPSATLAGGGPNATQPPITGTGVPGTDLGERIRAAVGSTTSVSLAMTTPAGQATALVDLGRQAVRLQTGPADSPVTLVHIGDSTWVSGAGPASGGPSSGAPAKHWQQLRPDRTDVISRKLGNAADVGSFLRLTAFTDAFTGLLGDQSPTPGGGTKTTFWVPASRYAEVTRAPASLAASLVKPVVVVVELDGSARPTRLTATIVSKGATMTDETIYTGWGQKVTIEAPPADDTVVAPLPGQAPDPEDSTPSPTAGRPSGRPTSGEAPSSTGSATRTSETGAPTGTTPTSHRPRVTVTVTTTPTG